MDLHLPIIGNLTDDPELRFTSNGVAVCRLTIAHNPRVKDQASGEWKDGEPTFITATAWRQLAENAAESLSKGARVIAAGRLRTERWEDKTSGDKRSRLVMDLDGIGPDLAYATAQVKKMARSNAGDPDDPWASASRTRPPGATGPETTGGYSGEDEPPF